MSRSRIWIGGIFLAMIVIVFSTVFLYFSSQGQTVPFTILEEGYSLVKPGTTPDQTPEPDLIVIASQEEMQQVEPLTFPEPLAMAITQVNFQRSFVVLVRRGHPEGGKITQVTRHADTVVIATTALSIGPGNYVDIGWTQPYVVVQIDKVGAWGQEIRFILQREGLGKIGETVHYIP